LGRCPPQRAEPERGDEQHERAQEPRLAELIAVRSQPEPCSQDEGRAHEDDHGADAREPEEECDLVWPPAPRGSLEHDPRDEHAAEEEKRTKDVRRSEELVAGHERPGKHTGCAAGYGVSRKVVRAVADVSMPSWREP